MRLSLTYRLLCVTAAWLIATVGFGQAPASSLERGISLYQEQDRIGALTQFLIFINSREEADHETALANHYVGRLFAESGLHKKALNYLLLAEGQNQGNTGLARDIATLVGDQYLQLNDPKKARQYFQALAETNAADAEERIVVYQKIASSFQAGPERNLDSSLYYNERILALAKGVTNPEFAIKAHNNLGYIHNFLKQYKVANTEFEAALTIANQHQRKDLTGSILLNQAIVLNNKGRQTQAIEKLQQARAPIFSHDRDTEKANYYNLLAGFYFKIDDVYRAELYNDSALSLASQKQHPESLLAAYDQTARIKNYYSDYKAENQYRERYTRLKDSLDQVKQDARMRVQQNAMDLEREESRTIIGIQENEILKQRTAKAEKERELQQQRAQTAEKERELAEARAAEAELAEKEALLEVALVQERALIAERDRQLLLQQAAIQEQEYIQDSISTQLLIERQRREAATREKQLALANANIVDQQLQLEESKRQNLIGFVVAMGIILLVALISLVYIRRSRQLLAVAKSQSDDLLLNILPVAVADELKSQGAAAPKQYEQVSVLFVDITGFTRIAEKLSPAELVAELDGYFREFDAITEQHNLEKIKTIGDAYMCAGGIPEPNTTNAVDAVKAAMGILACVQRLNGERAAGGQEQWNVRIGIHTGRVVAGVVGAKKFAYDIWGDAVNTAARLESTSEPGRVNISRATHDLVKNHFACTYRGQIAAKNKGLIDMYFVDGPMA